MITNMTANEAKIIAEKYIEDDVTVTIVDDETIRLSDGVAYKTIASELWTEDDPRSECEDFTNCD